MRGTFLFSNYIPILVQPDGVHLLSFKLRLFDLKEIHSLNIKGHLVAKISGLKI